MPRAKTPRSLAPSNAEATWSSSTRCVMEYVAAVRPHPVSLCTAFTGTEALSDTENSQAHQHEPHQTNDLQRSVAVHDVFGRRCLASVDVNGVAQHA